ncbi:ENDD1 protein, partial [Upupa epops]|nr:ENDD1 protein [Upupa epops]
SIVLVLCISALPSFSQGRVVREDESGFAECNAFFAGRVPPDGFAEPFHVKICQHFNKEPRFATLYSTRDKIPLYSAFKYSKPAPGEEEQWLVEPQLDDPDSALREMVREADVAGTVANLGASQALSSDYVDSGYERGLLNPGLLHEGDFQVAAYTLTNAVPLSPSLSQSWHRDVARVVEQALAPHCSQTDALFLVAGAIPSSVRVKGRVSVPESLWLAACCDAPRGWSLGLLKTPSDENGLADLTVKELEKRLPAGANLFGSSCGGDTQSPEAAEAALQAVRQIHSGQRQGEQDSSLVRKVLGVIATPFVKLLELLVSVLVGLLKLVLYFLWLLTKRVAGAALDGVCSLWDGLVSYLKAIGTVLLSIPCDVGRVLVNICLGFLQILQDLTSLTYRILSIPVGFVLHLAAFPYRSLCAIPSVLRDAAAGIGGTVSLLLDATAALVHGFCYLAALVGRRVVPRVSSDE